MYTVFVISLMLIPDDTLDELFYQLVWYRNFLKKENSVPEKCDFFFPFSTLTPSTHLAVCSPVDCVEYITSKGKQIP